MGRTLGSHRWLLAPERGRQGRHGERQEKDRQDVLSAASEGNDLALVCVEGRSPTRVQIVLATANGLGHYSVMRRIPRRLAALALLVLIVGGLFWFGRYLRERGIIWASEFSTIASLFVAVVALVAPIVARWLRPPAPMAQVTVVQAGDDLATSLGNQWADEDRLRRINDPRPLPVRWDITSTAQAAMAGVPYEGHGNVYLAGKFTEIHATFEQTQSRRLIILGTAGAGKSVLAIKLARELLAVRQSGMLIPVILPAVTWNPDTNLTQWISSQLESNYPGLALRVRTAIGEAISLAKALASTSILPILDGLDELPPKQRIRVIPEVNALGSDFPLVITSRPNEYLEAVESAGRGISRAIQGLNCQDFDDLAVARRVVVTGRAGGATAEL